MRTPLTHVLVGVLVFHLGISSAGAQSLLSPRENTKIQATEFFAADPDDGPLVKVQLWGDLGNPGYYHFPKGTTVLGMLGYVGGPKAVPDSLKIMLRRAPDKQASDAEPTLFRIPGEEVMGTSRWGNFKLASGDVIYMDGDKATPEKNTFIDTMRDILFIMTFVTTSFSTYLLITQATR